MDILSRFESVADDPCAYAGAWKQEHGKPVIGFFCSYAPEEIIDAAGALPFRITGTGRGVERADAHLQAYGCSLVRNTLADALAGDLDFLDGTVFPHTCDSIQRLSDIWRLNAGFRLHFDLVLPVKLDTDSAADYMHAVLKRFRRRLEEGLGVRIEEERLLRSADRFNRIRRELGRITDRCRRRPGILSGRQVQTIFKAAMVMDRRELLRDLETLGRELDARPAAEGTGEKRLVLAGGLCNPPLIHESIEEAGGRVVADDFCNGSRYAEGSIDTAGDVLSGIGRRYLERTVCPAKHRGLRARGDHLVRLARDAGADGVVFLFLKFCDPHAFDYPYLREMLDAAGIPSMLFEIEEPLPSEGQMRTRFEAFIEML